MYQASTSTSTTSGNIYDITINDIAFAYVLSIEK